MVEHIDISVGRILDKLEQLNLDENTIVIFFSDNGGLIRRFDRIPLIAESKRHIYQDDSLLYVASSNSPLRAEKGTLYEGGIREPLIIKWPGKIEPGTKSDAIISRIDFFPSLLDIVGETTNQVVDGESFLPELTLDRPDNSRNIFWHYPVYHHSVPASAVRSNDWKLIHFYDSDRSELYDLQSDISERNNLADANPQKRDELKNLLNTWLANTGADLPRPNPDFDEKKRFEWGTHPGREQLQQGEIVE
jgi:uncharacterized sulfatase